MDLHEYRQNFIAIGRKGQVKLNFFVRSRSLLTLLQPTGKKAVLVPDLDLLFKTKALVTSERSASRDWLDLWMLMNEHGFSIVDYVAAYEEVNEMVSLDHGFERLCSGRPRANDPGYQVLTAKEAPKLDEIAAYFREEIGRWKISVAEKRLKWGGG